MKKSHAKITILLCILISILCISFVSAREPLPRRLVDNPSYYMEILSNYVGFAEYSDFSVDEYSFYKLIEDGTEQKEVRGDIYLSSIKISTLGFRYETWLRVSIDEKNEVQIYPVIKKEEINKMINKYESSDGIRAFISIFQDNLVQNISFFGRDSSKRLTSGDYFIDYDFLKDDFYRYRLPITMSDHFPLLNIYKDKVEQNDCSIKDDTSIFVLKNDRRNTIMINAEVQGKCKRSDKYTDENIFEIEMPLKTDLWSRFKAWLRRIF